jgi:hypothetical protein
MYLELMDLLLYKLILYGPEPKEELLLSHPELNLDNLVSARLI